MDDLLILYMSLSATPNTVLLVMGMQNDKLISSTPPTLVPAVNASIRAAYNRGWKVVFSLDLHHPHHVSFTHGPPHCVLQSHGARLVRALDYLYVQNADMVLRGLDKDADSDDAFYVSHGSPSRLRDILWDAASGQYCRLCVCGVSPDGAMEATVRTATLQGYCLGKPAIISDASFLPPTHATFYTLDELLSLWD